MRAILYLSTVMLSACAMRTLIVASELDPPQLALVHVQELLLPRPLEEGRGAFISAASGMVEHEGVLYFVSDDEFSLFSQVRGQPLRALALGGGALPVAPGERKRVKPDFESLVLLSETEWPPHGALVAWPSGSKLNRMRAWTIPFLEDGTPGTPLESNILPLAYKLTSEAGKLNIEGLFVRDGKIFLLQRGNSRESRNGIFRMSLKAWMSGLRSGDWSEGTPEFQEVELGTLDGVRLSLSDAIWTPHGLLGLASAEDTQSPYAKGHVMGSVLVRIVDGGSEILGVFPAHVKLEGMLLERELADGSLQLLLVDDADDEHKPSTLYRATLTSAQLQTVKK